VFTGEEFAWPPGMTMPEPLPEVDDDEEEDEVTPETLKIRPEPMPERGQ
jgi:hypothetical protein